MVLAPAAQPRRPDRQMEAAVGMDLGMLEGELDSSLNRFTQPVVVRISAIPNALDAGRTLDDSRRRLEIPGFGDPHHLPAHPDGVPQILQRPFTQHEIELFVLERPGVARTDVPLDPRRL